MLTDITNIQFSNVFWFNVPFHRGPMRWSVVTVSTPPVPLNRLPDFTRVNLIHLGEDNIYNSILSQFIFSLLIIKCNFMLLENKGVFALLMESQLMDCWQKFTTLRTIIFFGSDMFGFNVAFHSSSMRRSVLTVSALPIRWMSALNIVNFIHLGHDNIYNIRFTLV